jgi:hypothetical protein
MTLCTSRELSCYLLVWPCSAVYIYVPAIVSIHMLYAVSVLVKQGLRITHSLTVQMQYKAKTHTW